MKTKTIELYEFSELSEQARLKVLEHERNINVDYDGWCEFELEEWKEKLEKMGFNDPKISYRGFYSQGDGASFVCHSVDVEKFARSQKMYGRFKALINAVKKEKADYSAEIYRIDWHYSHYNTISSRSELQYYEENVAEEGKLQELADELERLALSVAKDMSKQIYRDLESLYEGLTSDEAVIDTIQGNEYTFRADGTMEN